jgi:predicted phage-related endonuclease
MSLYTLKEVYKDIITEDQVDSSDIELKFSNNLASEFIRTVNEFTSVCAKMVKNRSVSKDLYKKFDDLNSKIKNLTDAAKNS